METPKKKPKPIWEYPKGYNFNEAEGREAYAEGRAMDSHGWGDSSAAKEFEAGWRQAKAKDEKAKAEAAKK